VLRELRTRHPALRFQLDPGEAVLDLTRREADIALRTARPTSGDLVVTKVATIRWVAAAARSLAREIGPVKRWTDVPWIGFGERLAQLPPARWHAQRVGADYVVRSESLAVQLSAVAAGLGVALVPAPSVAHYGLVAIELAPRLRADASAWPLDDLFLVTHRALRDVPRVQVVWDAVLARFAALNKQWKAREG
jgi:DNA-binding transcriptional LysR family regulator